MWTPGVSTLPCWASLSLLPSNVKILLPASLGSLHECGGTCKLLGPVLGSTQPALTSVLDPETQQQTSTPFKSHSRKWQNPGPPTAKCSVLRKSFATCFPKHVASHPRFSHCVDVEPAHHIQAPGSCQGSSCLHFSWRSLSVGMGFSFCNGCKREIVFSLGSLYFKTPFYRYVSSSLVSQKSALTEQLISCLSLTGEKGDRGHTVVLRFCQSWQLLVGFVHDRKRTNGIVATAWQTIRGQMLFSKRHHLTEVAYMGLTYLNETALICISTFF